MANNYFIAEYQQTLGGYRFSIWGQHEGSYFQREYPNEYTPPEPIISGKWVENLPPEYPAPSAPVQPETQLSRSGKPVEQSATEITE